jgi:hypothetical protein
MAVQAARRHLRRDPAVCPGARWQSVIDEYADDTLSVRPGEPVPYDGVIARATRELVRRELAQSKRSLSEIAREVGFPARDRAAWANRRSR